MKQQTNSTLGFADLVAGQRKVKAEFFNQINRVIDWAPVRRIIETVYTKGRGPLGRPGYAGAVLFRIELLCGWYELSDWEVEEQVNDRISFNQFAGLSLEDAVPGSTTVCRFRNQLVEVGLYDRLLDEINRQLADRGVLVMRGAIVDASVPPPPPPARAEGVRGGGGPQGGGGDTRGGGGWGGRSPARGAAPARGGPGGLLAAEGGPAALRLQAPHRHQPGGPGAGGQGLRLCREPGALRGRKLKVRIMRKAVRDCGLTERERAVSRAISRVRYRVERTFGSMRRWFGAGVARYEGLQKTHAQHIMESIAYNLYRAPGIIVSNGIE